ncbi:HlyD family efflux transporter periplasmic adaptor subunit, partial [Roseomonas sp. NAR14]|nr:HlyD family efflux transporter periplasmic adaptor subunit [Roseomonas acroporae]
MFPGQYVGIGTQVIALVPRPGLYVIANFRETQVARLREGQAAEIRIDSFPGAVLRGRARRVASGPRTARATAASTACAAAASDAGAPASPMPAAPVASQASGAACRPYGQRPSSAASAAKGSGKRRAIECSPAVAPFAAAGMPGTDRHARNNRMSASSNALHRADASPGGVAPAPLTNKMLTMSRMARIRRAGTKPTVTRASAATGPGSSVMTQQRALRTTRESVSAWREQEMFLLQEIMKQVGASLEPDRAIREMLHLLSEVLGLNRGRVVLREPEGEHYA